LTFRLRLALSVAGMLSVAMAGFGGVQLAASRAREDAAIDRELQARVRPFAPPGPNGPGPNGPGGFGQNGMGRFGPGPGLGSGPGPGAGPGARQRPFGTNGPEGQAPPGDPGRPLPEPRNPNEGLTDLEFWQRPIRIGLNGRIGEFDAGRPLPDPSALELRRRVIRTVDFAGQRVRVLTQPLPMGAVQTIVPLGDVESRRQREMLLFVVLLPIGFVLAAMAGWWLAGRATRPIDRLRTAASGTTAQTLARRIPEEGDQEFAELAAAYNQMLGRLDEAFERQRQFTADAAHELRTPLTRLGVAAGSALDDVDADPERLRRALGVARDAGDAMTRLVNDLLLLAQADRGAFSGAMETFDLRGLGEEFAEEGIVIDLPPEPVLVHGYRSLIARAVGNFVENAKKYGKGQVVVRITPGRIEVEDDGPGIPPEDEARVFERFYRRDAARSREEGGFGLGLAIAKAIAEAHDGRVGVQGSKFWIELPPQ